MAKKLTVEVDADVSKARRKIQQGLSGAGESAAGGSLPPAADKAARSLDKASASAEKLSSAASEGSARMGQMAKAFGGMALRMAASYASNQMEKGSTGQQVVKGAGDVAGGVMMGAVFGPLGAVAGGLMGLTSAIMEANAAEKARTEAIKSAQMDYAKSELYYEKNQEFDKTLKNLTNVGGKNGMTREESLSGLDGEISKFKAAIEENKRLIEQGIKSGNLDQVSLYREFLNQNRSKLSRLESAKEGLEKNTGKGDRTSTTALDALSKIGGGSFGGDFAREQLNVQKEMAASLKSIEQKSGTGGTWQ